MNLHDLFTLLILPIGTSRYDMTQVRYNTSQNEHQVTIDNKYKRIHSEVTITSTLPLNQEGVLSTQFISTGLLLCINWIIIELLSSYSSIHIHLQVIFITGSGSSLDHHCVIIIGSSLLDHHHWCYLSILLVIGSYTELALFHVGCRPSLHVGLLQRLYLTLSQNVQHSHLTMRGAHPTPCQKGIALTFTSMIGHNYYHL